MLYNIGDEETDMLEIEELRRRKRLRRKTLVCGIIIIVCFLVMGVGIWISVNNKTEAEVAEEKEEVVASQDEKYTGEHIQIEKHNLDKIRSEFLPKSNPNAQQEITNIYYSDEKVAYLTFDDGPSKNITPQILDILKNEQVPATFFVLGSRVELNPDLVKREYEEGHYIANHGYSHEYSQIYRSKETVLEEYTQCNNDVKNALGNPNYNTLLFRFPGGSSGGRYNDIKAEAKQYLAENNICHTNWNCLTGDAEGKTAPNELMAYFQETMKGDGSLIVLMHDASDKSYTAETLPILISYLREQGYTFKNFYEVFK